MGIEVGGAEDEKGRQVRIRGFSKSVAKIQQKNDIRKREEDFSADFLLKE